jgi:YggT family protein
MTLTSLIQAILTAVTIYTVIVVIRCLLTWFPNVEWYKQPFAALAQVSDPFLNLFRGLIPPIGGIDLSAMAALFALTFLQRVLQYALVSASI